MEPADELLLRLLAEHHLPCPVCGYDLHRLTAPRCSECGRTVVLKVFLADPPLRPAWIGALAAACLNAGLGLVMLLILIDFTIHATPRRARTELLPPGGLYDWAYYTELAMIFSPLVILSFRRRFLLLPMWMQISLALAAAGLGGLTFYGMTIQLR